MIPVLFLLIIHVFSGLTHAVAESFDTPTSVMVSKENQSVFSVGSTPDWVVSYETPFECTPPKPSEVNSQCLLIETQENWLEKAVYRHVAVKVFTQAGIEQDSEIAITFEPPYEKAIIHSI